MADGPRVRHGRLRRPGRDAGADGATGEQRREPHRRANSDVVPRCHDVTRRRPDGISGRPPPPDSPEPPRAILVGGADGPETGDLGTFSWDGLVSDSPWIVQRTGSPVTPGTRLRVRFDPRLQPRAWIARWAPIRHGEAGSPRNAGSGDGGRVAVDAPMEAGPWSLQLDATFADGRRAVWYWRLGVGG